MEKHADTSSDTADATTHKDVEGHKTKKRRLHGACDACRKKKSDINDTHPDRCTNCRLWKINCTHDMPRQPKKSETQAAYIMTLEETIEKMRRLLHAVYPEKDLQLLLEKPIDELPQAKGPPSPTAFTPSPMSSMKLPNMSSLSQEITHLTSSPSTSGGEEDDPEDFAHLTLAEEIKKLSLDTFEDRFFGRSSTVKFFEEAMSLRDRLAGTPQAYDSSKFRRPVYWDVRPWEIDYIALPTHPPLYDYPEDDLLRTLVFTFFEKFNSLLPLLHKPTFIKMLAENRHLRDPDFGMVVLMVCALASKYSHDPRVFSPGDASGLSSGWKYFSQVPMHRRSLLYKAGLFDLQYYVLASTYLIGSSIAQNSWTMFGSLVRYLVEMGGHRRKPHSQKPSAEEELMKRVFWCALYIDRVTSSFYGRPCLIQDEDYDIDFPIECDDEYWDPLTGDPDDAFKQPLGKPSYITAFVCSLKLVQILGLSLRTLYATKKAKVLSGLVGGEWEQRIVAELDSSLNMWKESVPQFLQWDPEREDSTFFHQSVSIHATFYYIQIQIHRPFLMKKSPLSLPSLAMCTNAARSCARLLEVSLTRGMRVLPTLIVELVSSFRVFLRFDLGIVWDKQVAAFCSGTVIVLNLWGIRYSGLLGDAAKETSNLRKCINVLKECEKSLLEKKFSNVDTINMIVCDKLIGYHNSTRWHFAGRSCDLLKGVVSLEEDYDSTAALPKRRRDGPSTDTLMSYQQHVNAAMAYAGRQPTSGADTMSYSLLNPSHNTTQAPQSQTSNLSNTNNTRLSMTHSMAITPVTFMSSGASIPPLAQETPSAPGASTTMFIQPMPMYNPVSNSLATDWALGDLLMMQMRYSQYEPNAQPDVGAEIAVQHVHRANDLNGWSEAQNISSDPLQQAVASQSTGHTGAQENVSSSPESFGNTEDLLSLFSDIPMSFSPEEWDSYLANMRS